jgi:SAM-dependent methyltransferase
MAIPRSAPARSPSANAGEKQSHCPICGGVGGRALRAVDRNREITQERFTYIRCARCGTTFLPTIPTDLGRYYGGGYYHFGADGEPAWRKSQHRQKVESVRIELLARHVEPGSLIEIGAGTGGFAAAAHDAGFEVTAIEMDSGCCRYLTERIGVTAICSDDPVAVLKSLGEARAVALWHVLEHLANPLEILQEAAGKLEIGGVLAIAVPNPHSLQFRLLRSRWAHLDAPRHLCLAPPAVLVEKLKSLGLSRVAATTNDPDGLECNAFGWASALRRRPASGPPSQLLLYGVLGLGVALAPLERTGLRGAAATMIFRKDRPTPPDTFSRL